MVWQFAAAVQQGWESYLTDPQQTNTQIVAANDDMDGTLLQKSAQAIEPLCRPPGFEGLLGSMELGRWQALRAQLIELELLPPDAPPAADAFVAQPPRDTIRRQPAN